jgi:hypothetical protein
MRGLALGIAIFVAGMRLSSAAEGRIDARTLCPVVISAFDAKNATLMQEFLRFVQNVFDDLDTESREKGEPALKAIEQYHSWRQSSARDLMAIMFPVVMCTV